MYFILLFRSEIQKKELDLARVKDANYDLTEERVQLTTKLTETEKKSKERKEELQKLKMRYVNNSTKAASCYTVCHGNLVIMK